MEFKLSSEKEKTVWEEIHESKYKSKIRELEQELEVLKYNLARKNKDVFMHALENYSDPEVEDIDRMLADKPNDIKRQYHEKRLRTANVGSAYKSAIKVIGENDAIKAAFTEEHRKLSDWADGFDAGRSYQDYRWRNDMAKMDFSDIDESGI